MEILKCLILAAFCIVVESGLSPHHMNDYNYTFIFTTETPDECDAVIRRERCSGIIIEATKKFGEIKESRSSFHHAFEHYCRKIPEYVPCVEANKADYMMLVDCDMQVRAFLNVLTTSADISRDQLWDLTIESLNRANDIICSRTDEIVGLIQCVAMNGQVFVPEWQTCVHEYASPLAEIFMGISSGEPLELSELCRSTLGYVRCSLDAMAAPCPGGSELIDTIYDDVFVDVIGNGFGCESETNPLLSLIRSVRSKLRR